jgi:hypothetical protein
MKATFALLTGVVTILAFATPSHAQLQASSLIGNYVVTGTESDGKKYDGPGPLAITMDKNGALELKWDGGKYIGIGQVVGQHACGRDQRGEPRRDHADGGQARRLAGRQILAPHRRRHQRHRGLEEEVSINPRQLRWP